MITFDHSFVKHIRSDVVYSIQCIDCQQTYVGKTERQCIGRMCEHGDPQNVLNNLNT